MTDNNAYQNDYDTESTMSKRSISHKSIVLDVKQLEEEKKKEEAEGEAEQSEEGEEGRQQWSNPLDFLFSAISYCVGLGNIWRFPYLAHKYGGGAFLICYLLSTLICGIPFLMLEISLGQFFGVTQISSLQQICPIMKGAGFSSIIMQFYINLYFPVIIAWALFYLCCSFARLPDDVTWAHCDHDWNTDQCVASGEAVDSNHTSSVEEFWNIRTLQITGGMSEIDGMNWELVGLMFFGWVLCYFIIWKGLAESGKIIWFSALFPYIILTILLGRAVTLEGAKEGLKYFVTPDWEMLKTSGPWIEGGTQIFYSFGIGMGSLITLGSYNKYKHDFYKETLFIGVVNVCTSIYAAIVTFSVLGYMASSTGQAIEDVVKSGPGLTFIIYPEVVTTLPGAPWWAMLFFVMMLILGIDSQFCGVEAVVAGCLDNWKWLQKKKFWFTLISCIVTFLMAFPMVTKGGPYVFELLNIYAASGMCLLWAVAIQVIVVNWVWGSDNVYKAIYEMTGVKLSPFWMICWKFVGPAFMICIFVFYFVEYAKPMYEDVPYEAGGQAIGLLISCSSMVMIPGYAIYYIITSGKPFKEALKEGFTPNIIGRPESRKPVDTISHQIEEVEKEELNEPL